MTLPLAVLRAAVRPAASVFLVALLVVAGPVPPAPASQLLAPSAGTADLGLFGTAIAKPRRPSGALFHNPAGLAAFQGTTVNGDFGLGFAKLGIGNNQARQNSNVLTMIPNFAVAVAGRGRWHYGIGAYGAVGASYDFDPLAQAGLDQATHAETSILSVPMALAYRVNDRVNVGAQLIASFGHLRNRYTLGGQPFRYTLRGPGVQAMFGVTWKATPVWSWGLALHTPGLVWMDGSMAVSDGVRRDVDLELQLPMKVALGVEHQLTEKIALLGSASWINSKNFASSKIRFAGLSAFNVPFLPAAKDEWRAGVALEVTPAPRWKLRAGIGHANAIVGTRGISPLVYDTDDLRVGVGAGFEHNTWTIDVMGGYAFHDSQHVSADQAPLIPGDYSSSGSIISLGLTRRL